MQVAARRFFSICPGLLVGCDWSYVRTYSRVLERNDAELLVPGFSILSGCGVGAKGQATKGDPLCRHATQISTWVEAWMETRAGRGSAWIGRVEADRAGRTRRFPPDNLASSRLGTGCRTQGARGTDRDA